MMRAERAPAGPLRLLLRRVLPMALVGSGLAWSATGSPAREPWLQVVDSPLMPEEAAAIEERPYSMLLEKVRFGPDQAALAAMAGEFSYDALRASPERFRGRVVFAGACTVVEIRRSEAPRVGRSDRDEVFAGIAAELDARRGDICLWAFRFLRRTGDALLYPGDRVNMSGYFLKNVPLLDARGDVHWMPLVVGPWPSYTGRWIPAAALRRLCPGLLPSREVPHERVRSRTVLGVLADGSLLLGGEGPSTRERALTELRRSASARPRRAVVAVCASPSARETAMALLDEAGVKKVAWKELVRPTASGAVPPQSSPVTATAPAIHMPD